MAWAIRANPVDDRPNAGNPDETFGWLYMKDLNTPAIPSLNTTAFEAGEPYVTVKNQKGIHYGPADFHFGAENNPNAIHFEANFAGAMGSSTYQTNHVVVELYTP
jgi:hypothetical protein